MPFSLWNVWPGQKYSKSRFISSTDSENNIVTWKKRGGRHHPGFCEDSSKRKLFPSSSLDFPTVSWRKCCSVLDPPCTGGTRARGFPSLSLVIGASVDFWLAEHHEDVEAVEEGYTLEDRANDNPNQWLRHGPGDTRDRWLLLLSNWFLQSQLRLMTSALWPQINKIIFNRIN